MWRFTVAAPVKMTENQSRNLLLSVKPNFADLLLSGEKTAELRRTQPRVNPGAVALVYSSTPQKALVGAIRIDSVHTLDPAKVWERWAPRCGLRRAEFNNYVAGCNAVTVLLPTRSGPFPSLSRLPFFVIAGIVSSLRRASAMWQLTRLPHYSTAKVGSSRNYPSSRRSRPGTLNTLLRGVRGPKIRGGAALGAAPPA